jgi:hypothetical protein
MVALSGLLEVAQTLGEDLLSGKLHSAHGVALLGLWHMTRSLAEIFEASGYLKEGLD